MARTRRSYEATKSEIAACLNCTLPPNACDFCCGNPETALVDRAEQAAGHPKKQTAARKPHYSKETRDKAIEMVRNGYSYDAVEQFLGVGHGTVRTWWRKVRDEENVRNNQ